MIKDLIPIKVKIGLRPNGHADHPDWYKLPLAQEMEPSTQMFFGWKYDKTSGHKESTEDSPYGMQWGMVFVTERFAKEAKEVFPDLITELSEEEAKDFYENKVTAHIPENTYDINILQALQTELSLRKELELTTGITEIKEKITKAIDPNDTEPGIIKNKEKKFSDFKVAVSLNVTATKK